MPLLRLVLLAQVLLSALPVHAHVDHSGEVAHIEPAHGGHDITLVQTDERQRSDPPAFLPAPSEIQLVASNEIVRTARQPEPASPPSRPPVAQPPPRAPPIVL